MGIIRETFSFFAKNIVLIVCITITVWFPVNILINYLMEHVFVSNSTFENMRNISYLTALFRPISAAAIIYLVYKSKQNETVNFKQAMLVGIQKWIPLIIANFLAGIIVGLTFIFFFIPGVYFVVKYSFIDSIVVVNESTDEKPRKISYELTKTHGWRILGIGLLFLVIYLIILTAVLCIPVPFQGIEKIIFESLRDCITDIVYSLITISMFLLYWNAVKGKDLGLYPSETM